MIFEIDNKLENSLILLIFGL